MMQDTRHHAAAAPGELIGSLVGGLSPVTPVRLVRTIAVAALIEFATVLATAWLLGARVAGASRLVDPMFVALLMVLAGGALASVAAMARLSIPGRPVAAATRLALVALPLVLAAAVVAISPWGGTWTGFGAVFLEGLGCTRTTLMVAAPAWLAGLVYLRRLAPLEPLAVGLFSASAALLTSALAVQMACASCDSWHLAISHYAPILAATWLAAILSPPVLRSRR